MRDSRPPASERLKSKRQAEVVFKTIFAIVAAAFCFGIIFLQAWIESETYNRLTGKDTTWIDALGVELRVSDGVQP